MNMSKTKIASLLFSIIIASLFLTLCKKDQTCRAQITVVDKAGLTISGATVTLFTKKIGLNPDIEITKTTNANGLAEFAYKDPVILDIKATLGLKRNDTLELIKLEKAKTVQKTVIINL
jgi:hypothetical protein